jgi:large subunit ribosomal protein L23
LPKELNKNMTIDSKNEIAIIKKPRVTEKATDLAGREKNPGYVFEVFADANKTEIKKAIQARYKVTPTKICIISLPAKKVVVRGKRGTKASVKKAIVYLKTGEKIELV